MAKGYKYRALEADGHYEVIEDTAGIVGTVAKTVDGWWRGYGIDGSELSGAPAFRTRDEAAEALQGRGRSYCGESQASRGRNGCQHHMPRPLIRSIGVPRPEIHRHNGNGRRNGVEQPGL